MSAVIAHTPQIHMQVLRMFPGLPAATPLPDLAEPDCFIKSKVYACPFNIDDLTARSGVYSRNP
jgi:hypothetical protein